MSENYTSVESGLLWLWVRPDKACIAVDKIVAVYVGPGDRVMVATVNGEEYVVTHPDMKSVTAVINAITGGWNG